MQGQNILQQYSDPTIERLTGFQGFREEPTLAFDGKDAQGTFFPDAPYSFRLQVADVAGNLAPEQTQTLVIDTLPPDLTAFTLSETLISPQDSNGIQDTLTIQGTVTDMNLKEVLVHIREKESQLLVFQKRFAPEDLTEHAFSFTFDGTCDRASALCVFGAFADVYSALVSETIRVDRQSKGMVAWKHAKQGGERC